LNDSASLQVTKENAKIFQKELTALDKDLGIYVSEIEAISVNDPNSQKKTFDAMNKYKSARTKTLNLLTEITRKDLKNIQSEEAQSMLKRLNRFDNAANSSQSELKKLQKELAQNIHK
jgi:oligoendopeptidase F